MVAMSARVNTEVSKDDDYRGLNNYLTVLAVPYDKYSIMGPKTLF